ncbi:hypothetical protein ACFO3Q_13035 [Coralloluteibacterium thermophilus]|uniref:Uncharacterized protein n=2 Tax=Coralloluteibacterium thermophilum TaxID=2707049 RepID=A0ABV9NL93_9GAMM
MSDNKVVNLALVASGDPSEVAKAVGELRTRLPGMIEYQRIMARLQREAYLAYLAEGFTPKQALDLAKEVRP